MIPEIILFQDQSRPLPSPLIKILDAHVSYGEALRQALRTDRALGWEKKKKKCKHTILFQQPLSGNSERANAITKFSGVFIAADLRPFSVVDEQAVFLNFSRNYEPYRVIKTKGTYRNVTFVYRYTLIKKVVDFEVSPGRSYSDN